MIHVGNRATRCLLISALAAALVAVPVALGGANRGAGSLALQVALRVDAFAMPCPPDAPPGADLCSQRTGNGRVPGLGVVRESYLYFADENPSPSCGGVRPLHSTGQIVVSGKGTIQFDLARADECFPDVMKTTQSFTITGGSGPYAGAAGAGTLAHDLHYEGSEPAGTDAWSGSLDVPGLEFDLTPPTLNGLVDKTVRVRKGVKRVRVKYRVTARDLGGGSLQAMCRPGSGSRFRVGRTLVKCSVTDTSANTATGSFRVLVKRRC
jgi:HYR domain